MNKTGLITAVSSKLNLNKKDVEAVINETFDTIIEALSCEDKVQVIGFGTFEVRNRSERQGRDPRTNEVITIAASKNPAFKAGKALKEAVNKN